MIHKQVVHLSRSLVLFSVAALVLTACGGGSLSGPSATGGVVVNGSVIGAAGSSAATAANFGFSSQSVTMASSVGTVTVSVQGQPSITTTVSADGSFTLRGLPSGSFTLVFSRDGTQLGTLSFGSVMPNQEVTITVSVTATTVALVQEQRTGVGHGDLEIEGLIAQVVTLNASGDSRFIIDQKTVVVRPGQTAIREGDAARQLTDLTVGRRVHVKGTYLPMEGSVQPLLATEIVLQGSVAGGPSPTPTPRPACIIEGGVAGSGIELEGTVVSGNATAFRLDARSSSPVDVNAGGATLVCTPPSGPNAPTPAQCAASVASGARVHVSGTLNACSATSASVTASRVQVQK
ncbi:MAG: carboxypeptidase-like regulatory domain-containing protein [Vicinamibacteria bacterium]